MREHRALRIVVLLGAVAALLTTAAVPLPGEAVAARSELVRLTIENRSSGTLYVWLDGPAFYYLEVGAEETEVAAVARGEYTYRFRACGDTVTGTLDLQTRQKVVMPMCGGRAVSTPRAAGAFDISNQIKIVRVTFENDSGTRLLAILTGPTTYVFDFKKGEEKEFTIAKGDYKVQVFACGRSGTRNFSAFRGKKLVFECPKP